MIDGHRDVINYVFWDLNLRFVRTSTLLASTRDVFLEIFLLFTPQIFPYYL